MPPLPDSQKPLVDGISAVRSRVQALEVQATRLDGQTVEDDLDRVLQSRLRADLAYRELDRLLALVLAEVTP